MAKETGIIKPVKVNNQVPEPFSIILLVVMLAGIIFLFYYNL